MPAQPPQQTFTVSISDAAQFKAIAFASRARFKQPGVIDARRIPALLEPAAIWKRPVEAHRRFSLLESAGTVAWSSGCKRKGDRAGECSLSRHARRQSAIADAVWAD